MSSRTTAVIVGYGWVGAIIAHELASTGNDVVVLERGEPLEHNPSGYYYREGGERLRLQHAQRTSLSTVSLRHCHDRMALPIRRPGSFVNGEGMGGAGVLWNGNGFRFCEDAFRPASLLSERPANKRRGEGFDVCDWPVRYCDLEADYERFEHVLGIAGNDGENPFAGARSGKFPQVPEVTDDATRLYREAAGGLGFHPFTVPTSDVSKPFTNPLGVERTPSAVSGTTLATPLNTLFPATMETGKVTFVTNARVRAVLHDGRRARGVAYIDNSGEKEIEAEVVVLGAWTLENTRLLLQSEIGQLYDPIKRKGVVGRGFCGHINIPTTGFFDRPFEIRDRTAVAFADFDPRVPGRDDLFGAALHIASSERTLDPFDSDLLPEGVARWGKDWKSALQSHHGRKMTSVAILEVIPSFDRHLDLDPTYRDAWGDPLLRLTYNYNRHDRSLIEFHSGVAKSVMAEAGATSVRAETFSGDYDTVRYQNTHLSGGARMGSDPETSAVDANLRSWSLENLWVVGASALPSASAPPPTLTVGALAYRASRDVISFLQ